MKQEQKGERSKAIPRKAVLLIPEPEGERAPYGVKPGYYDPKQVLKLVLAHKDDADAIRFIADMLETGDPENDGFAVMLRTNRNNPAAIDRIVEAAGA